MSMPLTNLQLLLQLHNSSSPVCHPGYQQQLVCNMKQRGKAIYVCVPLPLASGLLSNGRSVRRDARHTIGRLQLIGTTWRRGEKDKTNAIVLSHSLLAQAASRASTVRPWLLGPSPLCPSSSGSAGAPRRPSAGRPSASAPGRRGAGGGAGPSWWCAPAGRPAPTCSSSPSCSRSRSSSAPSSPPPASPTTSTSGSSGRWRSTRRFWRRTRLPPRRRKTAAGSTSSTATRPRCRRRRRSRSLSPPLARAPGTGPRGKCIS